MNEGYLYVLQEREFIRTKEPIYKVGFTKQDGFKRFNGYSKGSILHLYCRANDVINKEKKLLKILNNKFIKRSDFGNELFEGNIEEIKNTVYNICCDKTNILNEEKIHQAITLLNDIIKNKDIPNKRKKRESDEEKLSNHTLCMDNKIKRDEKIIKIIIDNIFMRSKKKFTSNRSLSKCFNIINNHLNLGLDVNFNM